MGELADKVRAIRERLDEIEIERGHLQAELDEIRDAAGVTPERRRGRRKAKEKRPIREGTMIGYARLVLQERHQPWYIDDLKKDIEILSGKTIQKSSLVSSLSRFVRAGEIFTRPKEGYYGLVEFEVPEDAETKAR